MGRPGPQTQAKRQREQAKREKRQAKDQRRAARKAAKNVDKSAAAGHDDPMDAQIVQPSGTT